MLKKNNILPADTPQVSNPLLLSLPAVYNPPAAAPKELYRLLLSENMNVQLT